MIDFIIFVVVIGLILWLVTTYVPMDAKVKQFLSIAVVILLVLGLVRQLGYLRFEGGPSISGSLNLDRR